MWSRFFSQPRPVVRPRQTVRKLMLEQLDDRLTPAAIAPFAVSAGGTLQDSGQGVGADAFGNVYVAGTIQGSQSPVDTNAYVTKYSATGVLQWSHEYGSIFGDSANAIAVDRAGYSYVTGSFRGQVAFAAGLLLNSTGEGDGFVIKLDPAGNVLWAHQLANIGNLGNNLYDRLTTSAPKGIAVDSTGNVVVTGFFNGRMDMDPANPGVHTLNSVNGPNGSPGSYVVKLNSGGNFVWEAQADGESGAKAYGIAVDAKNNVYTIGTFGNHAWFNDITATAGNQPNANSRKLTGPNWDSVYVWKLYANGTNAWARQMESSPQASVERGLGIAVDKIANVYTTGSFNGVAVDFNPVAVQAGDTLTSTGGSNDVWIDKMDSNGLFKWVRQAGGVGDDWGTGIALDVNGNPYVTGYITKESMFGNQLLTPVSPLGNSFIAQLNPAGDFLCAQKAADVGAAAPGLDKAAAIAVDSLGYVNLTGAFARQMQWPGLPMLNSVAGSGDIFTIKTKLVCSPTKAAVVNGILHLTGTNDADNIAMTDNGEGVIQVTLHNEAPRVYRHIKGITAVTLGGPDTLDYVLRRDAQPGPTVQPANLRFDLGDDNDLLNIRSEIPNDQAPPPDDWRVDFKMGSGHDETYIIIEGCVPAFLTGSSGSGDDVSAYEYYFPTKIPPRTVVTLDGGDGRDDLRVRSSFIIEGSAPNPGATSATHNLRGGPGNDFLSDDWQFVATPGSPGEPPRAFNVALNSNLDGGTGTNDLDLRYGFSSPTSAGGFPGMVINAPIMAKLTSGGTDSTQKVNFFNNPAYEGWPAGTLRVNSAISIDWRGGAGSQAIDFNLGSGGQGGIMPVFLTGSMLTVHLTGGAGEDVMALNAYLDASSTGRVNIEFHGAGGNDILTLGIFGYVDPNKVSALLDGGLGWDTAYHTGGIEVTNVELEVIA
jgi:Beta-propeller repeat